MMPMSNVIPIPQWSTGDRLRKARRDSGIGSQEMAARLGVARNTVTNYEADRTVIGADHLVTWCAATGCSADWILGLSSGSTLGTPPTACNGARILRFPPAAQEVA